jgi:hypothetical protein
MPSCGTRGTYLLLISTTSIPIFYINSVQMAKTRACEPAAQVNDTLYLYISGALAETVMFLVTSGVGYWRERVSQPVKKPLRSRYRRTVSIERRMHGIIVADLVIGSIEQDC